MTTKVKGYPFEVSAGKANSVILADQVKSLDWKEREAEKKGRVSKAVLQEVLDKLHAIVG
jgi:mRNA interferase MazF